MSTTRIAFIGAGAIGLPMAQRAARSGDVTIVDVSEERLALARERGLGTTTSIADALPADIVLVMVATAGQAKSVLEGENGIYALCGPETTVVILSTLGPDAVRELGAMRPASGPALLDVPVTGGIPGAIAGTLTLFAGGEEAIVERHRDVLESMGTVFAAGTNIGDGQSFKMVNQLLATSQLVVAAEALTLAEQLGLDTTRVFNAVRGGAGGSWMLENYGPRMLEGDVTDIAARLDIFLKDCILAQETAQKVQFDGEMISATRRVLERAVGLGYGAHDASTVTNAYVKGRQ
jgi:3-hydroxyisobutyrate dehydrogenase-like beta-hydroxyacid dehydrogenase